jgi:hypothetical protein
MRGKVQAVLVGVGAGDIELLADAALLLAASGLAEVGPGDGANGRVYSVQHPWSRHAGQGGRIGEAEALDEDGVGHVRRQWQTFLTVYSRDRRIGLAHQDKQGHADGASNSHLKRIPG